MFQKVASVEMLFFSYLSCLAGLAVARTPIKVAGSPGTKLVNPHRDAPYLLLVRPAAVEIPRGVLLNPPLIFVFPVTAILTNLQLLNWVTA